jgi:SSS family solute:Na+ symporter
MLPVDWLIVVAINGAVIAWGFYLARGTTTSEEWFLGHRALPWWLVGLSMFATHVDSSDLVTNAGYSYAQGIQMLTAQTLATAIGGILAAFWVVPAIYKAGLYTNAEYLEARFGPGARVLSAVIQIQYRTCVLGMIIASMHLLLTKLAGLESAAAWRLITALAALVVLYTLWGGLKSVVGADAVQGLVILAGAAVLFVSVWREIGSWPELKRRLATADATAQTAHVLDEGDWARRRPGESLDRIGAYRGALGRTSPWVVVTGWIIVVGSFWTVSHSQVMQLLGTRSLWDMKMAALFGTAISMPVMSSCVFLGLCGRALHPALTNPDDIFPWLAGRYLAPGLKGLLVAAVIAAALSTFNSMSSALSALFTRDVYARLIARDRDDAHYVRISRWSTLAMLVLGFAYVPFLSSRETLVSGYMTLASVFVTPLFATYLAGVFTRAHPRSALVGLAAGALYGVAALYDREVRDIDALPWWFTETSAAFCWSLLITACAIGATTLVWGRAQAGELRVPERGGWLGKSAAALPPAREYPFGDEIAWWQQPGLYAAVFVALAAYLVFGVFW